MTAVSNTKAKVALFAPCFVDQLFPHVAIAAIELLERLGIAVDVPTSATCCGQPAANAGFEHDGDRALRGLVHALEPYDRIIILSGSCCMHVRAHASEIGSGGKRVAERSTELCAYLHDEVGLDAVRRLGVRFPHRVGLHVGCHALRGLGLARPSEIQLPPFNKVRALLEAVEGVSFASLARPDECCGFGGTFAVTEPAISARMGRDRLDDYAQGGAEVIVSTDMSCMMHLGGIAIGAGAHGGGPPMVHVAEVLAGHASLAPRRIAASDALGART